MIQNRNLKQRNNKLANLYWGASAMLTSAVMSVTGTFAAATVADMWTKISEMFKDVYGHILGISTILAVVMASIALVIRLVSKNQRSVDEATQWLKRIVITWIILNSLGFIVAYISPLFAGGNYGGVTPQ